MARGRQTGRQAGRLARGQGDGRKTSFALANALCDGPNPRAPRFQSSKVAVSCIPHVVAPPSGPLEAGWGEKSDWEQPNASDGRGWEIFDPSSGADEMRRDVVRASCGHQRRAHDPSRDG